MAVQLLRKSPVKSQRSYGKHVEAAQIQTAPLTGASVEKKTIHSFIFLPACECQNSCFYHAFAIDLCIYSMCNRECNKPHHVPSGLLNITRHSAANHDANQK